MVDGRTDLAKLGIQGVPLVAGSEEQFLSLGKILAGVVPVVEIGVVEGMIQAFLRRTAVLWAQWQ